MAPLKSLSIYLKMYIQLYADVADCCSIPTRERRADVRRLRARFATEGLSFFTKTLPRLGKSLDEALATGNPIALGRFATTDQAPKLFGDLWRKVLSNGKVRSDAIPYNIRYLRQLCMFFYKLEVPVESEEVLNDFVAVDAALPSLEDMVTADSTVLGRAAFIATQVFGSLDPRDIVPRHGPGSVATRESVEEKSVFSRFYPKLHESYPYDQYFFGGQQFAENPNCIEELEVAEPRARVVLVPKDSRGPRIISCEPLEIQYIQQGLAKLIVARLESHPFTKGFVNFTDQSVNRNLALLASCDNSSLGTFDMKEASDRVSLELVQKVFQNTPLLPYLENTRSTSTVLPDGRIVELKKYAPMGSSLCFPVEAFVFFALIVASRAQWYGAATRRLAWLRQFRPYVYGDDLIFDTKDYGVVEQIFARVGLAFNTSKCCTAPGFRESCGMDAYKGSCVTPLRCKELWSSNRSALPAYVALANNARQEGYYRLAAWVQNQVESHHGPLPYVGANAPALGWTVEGNLVELNRNRKTRFCKRTMRTVALTYAPRPMKVRGVDSYADVFRNLNGSARDEAGRYTLQRRIQITRCWRAIT